MNTSTLSLTIQLPKFEGPLALLLYLIRKEEMDIFDIEIHRITAQYLEFIRLMKELDLEVAGEFIAMASTLIQIKSRMLLPQYNEQGEIVESEDPRKELVQRLLEYQKYQEAGKSLYERPLLGRDVWTRGRREKFEERILEEIELEENALYSLITAYRRAYKAAAKRIHKVAAKTQSIASRIMQIKDRLLMGVRVAMSTLIDTDVPAEEKRRQILITFLSTLELAKMGFVRLFQSDTYQEIHIETVKVIEAAAVSHVEEYESLHNEDGNAAAALEPLRMDSVPEEEPGSAQLSLLDQPMSVDGEAGLEDFVLHEAADGSGEELLPVDEIASDDEILAAELELEGVILTAEPVLVPVTELINPNLDAIDFVTNVSDLNAEVLAEIAQTPVDEIAVESMEFEAATDAIEDAEVTVSAGEVEVTLAEANFENLQFAEELSTTVTAEEPLVVDEPEILIEQDLAAEAVPVAAMTANYAEMTDEELEALTNPDYVPPVMTAPIAETASVESAEPTPDLEMAGADTVEASEVIIEPSAGMEVQPEAPAGASVMDFANVPSGAQTSSELNFAGLGIESEADLDLAPEDLKKNEGKTDVEI